MSEHLAGKSTLLSSWYLSTRCHPGPEVILSPAVPQLMRGDRLRHNTAMHSRAEINRV